MAPPKHAGLKVKSVEGVPLEAQQLCVDLASIGETRPRYVTHDAVPMEMGSREPSTGQPLVHQVRHEVSGCLCQAVQSPFAFVHPPTGDSTLIYVFTLSKSKLNNY